jgi:hypothetical protein
MAFLLCQTLSRRENVEGKCLFQGQDNLIFQTFSDVCSGAGRKCGKYGKLAAFPNEHSTESTFIVIQRIGIFRLHGE